MLAVAEALTMLLDAVETLDTVDARLAGALGRTLADRIVADRDFPPTDRSAMDGFAVRAADCAGAECTLRVAGEVRAGQNTESISIGVGEAMRIFTGGVIPRGADAVVMLELAEEDRGSGTVRVKERPHAGQNVRRRGEDRRAGETVAEPGDVVRAAEIAALAAVGHVRVRVVRTPRVAVISTGDEIVEVEAIPAAQQVRNSNAPMLLALLASMRIDGRYLGIAEDDPAALDAMIAEGLACDVLLLSGGVSVGAYDLVGAALVRAGCEVLFHRVAMRPGKPIMAAKRDRCLVLGLPGNPVSAFAGFQVFVAPALRKLMGDKTPVARPVRAKLVERLPRTPGRVTYHLAHLAWRNGEPMVSPVRSAGSGDVLSLVRANAFIVAPGDPRAIEAGEDVDVVAWRDEGRVP